MAGVAARGGHAGDAVIHAGFTRPTAAQRQATIARFRPSAVMDFRTAPAWSARAVISQPMNRGSGGRQYVRTASAD